MRLADAVLPEHHLCRTFFRERERFLLSWDGGPVLGAVGDDGRLHIGAPADARRVPGGARVGLDGDAVLYVEEREVFAAVHLDADGTEVVVVEHGLDGGSERWRTALPPTGRGGRTLTDVVHGVDEAGTACLVLTVRDEAGGVVFHAVGPGRAVRTHRPAVDGQLVHWDLRCDAAVVREDRGPWDPRLYLERPLSGAAPESVVARWADGLRGRALLVETPPDSEGRPVLWDLADGSSVPLTGPAGHIDDARFVRDGSGRILVVATADGSDVPHLWSPHTGTSVPLASHGTGRLRIRTAGPRGIGMYQVSTLGGSGWLWLGHDGAATLHRSPGDVPRYGGRATLSSVRCGRTPMLRYLPERRPPTAVVVSLHGGPESLERDELRWDGLYRDLLDAGIAVLGVDYCGSAGHGPLHTRRAWKAWTSAFREDVEACVEAAAGWGVEPGRVALLGGSFGGALALLGCVLRHDLAGAVAAAPLIDIRGHAERAAAADPFYRDWFAARFELAATATPAQRVFDPAHLAGTGPGQRVVLVHGSEDEVTQWQHSRHITDEATRRGLPWMLVTEPGVGHVPADADETEQRYRNVRGALTEVLGRTAPAPQ
ncbi:prolyl oligopeptidase family serine peptidase [Streptomyces sp. S12]|nr:prolyl oligopeptidase family serine peptidase [Streptomyces sp. S12]